jgi:branched-chain amino acid transport system permease protein
VLFLKMGVSPWIGMLAGGVIAVLIAVAVGVPTFRLEGRHFAIATMALAEIMAVIFKNWKWVGEAIGLFLPLMPESLANFQFHSSKLPYYYIMLGLLGATLMTVYRIERSRPGYYFKAIRENPTAARSLGISITKYKQLAGALSAFFTAIAGTFYAQYVLYIDPVSVMQSLISLLAILVAGLGGMGTLWGPVIGAVVLIPISELTRVRWGGGGRAVHLVYYGVLIMVIAAYQPHGLMGLLDRIRRRMRSATSRSD